MSDRWGTVPTMTEGERAEQSQQETTGVSTEAIAWNRPHDVHTGAADPTFDRPHFLPTA